MEWDHSSRYRKVACGEDGLVLALSLNISYKTSTFERFPREDGIGPLNLFCCSNLKKKLRCDPTMYSVMHVGQGREAAK